MNIFTIGFTRKSAEKFFELLRSSNVKRIVDVRLNNISQLAGFTKRDDLRYFAKKVCGIDYMHLPILAPTQEMLNEYKKNDGNWDAYENRFLDLMKKRRIENMVSKADIESGCLLCSEDKPHNCHRRIVAEYFAKHWDEDVNITHLT